MLTKAEGFLQKSEALKKRFEKQSEDSDKAAAEALRLAKQGDFKKALYALCSYILGDCLDVNNSQKEGEEEKPHNNTAFFKRL